MLKNKSLISLLFSNFAITLIGLITGLILAKFTSLEVRGEVGKILVWVTFGINLITLGTIEYYYSGGVNKRLVIDKIIYFIVGGFLIFSISLFFYFNNLKEYIYYILFLGFFRFLTLGYPFIFPLPRVYIKKSFQTFTLHLFI